MEIELRNIKYKNNNEILLNNINITFQEKNITSIIGPSGSGKSLIGHIILNLIEPTEGYIMLDGIRNYDTNKSLKDIGYVFQNPEEAFFNKTVYKEIAYSLKQFKYKLEKESDRVKKSLKMVGLKENILNTDPQNLSSGEKEKLAIAISLILNPKVIILDEPTIYLDNKSKKELIKLLKKLKKEYDKNIIIMSNDIEFVHQISDKIILLNNGEIVLNIDNELLLNNCDKLQEVNMEIPRIIKFINMIKKNKKINLESTNNIDELVKDICKNVKE